MKLRFSRTKTFCKGAWLFTLWRVLGHRRKRKSTIISITSANMAVSIAPFPFLSYSLKQTSFLFTFLKKWIWKMYLVLIHFNMPVMFITNCFQDTYLLYEKWHSIIPCKTFIHYFGLSYNWFYQKLYQSYRPNVIMHLSIEEIPWYIHCLKTTNLTAINTTY